MQKRRYIPDIEKDNAKLLQQLKTTHGCKAAFISRAGTIIFKNDHVHGEICTHTYNFLWMTRNSREDRHNTLETIKTMLKDFKQERIEIEKARTNKKTKRKV